MQSGSSRPQPELPGMVAGRYRLTRRIARGGIGEVFAAVDVSTGQDVALKRLQENVVSNRSVLAHFMREYHVLSELSHPRIVQVFDYGVDGGAPYYTMELLDGSDLRDLAPVPYREACRYLRDVASSLALLHARRLLHRDISPRNVRRTGDGHCKLLDFGAMIPFGVPPNITGTPPCVAPEALSGGSLDQRSDLYSLGALAYCILTGRHAHDVSVLDELPHAWERPLKRVRQRLSDVPEELDQLVMELLSVDPMKRPKSAAEVIDWLSAVGQLPPDETGIAARSFLTGTRLCGRDAHVLELDRRLERVAAGSGCTILIEGGTGSGKSRLLHEAALLAQTRGLAVVRGVARPQRSASQLLAQELVAALIHVAPADAERAGARNLVWNIERHATNSEARADLQYALNQMLRSFASARPLLLAIDDLDQADELSIAQLASLAHQARELPLMIVCASSEGRNPAAAAAMLALRSAALTLAVSDLNERENAQLVASMFGDVPRIEPTAEFIYRASRGNPRLIVELAEHLVRSEIARYVEGTWLLPEGDLSQEMPSNLQEAWTLRLANLPPDVLTLAELLCVRRGGASAELCLAAAGPLVTDVFAALDSLVQRGALESAGDDYVFAHAALRAALERRLSPARRQELHGRWAEVLRARSDASDDVELELGWHLVHGADRVAGAKLLGRVAPRLIEQGVAMGAAIPAAERALAIYEEQKMPLEECLQLRSTLVLAGFLFDYKLAHRYGDETLKLLYRECGMALANRLRRWVGGLFAMALALSLTWLRRLVSPRARRPPKPYVAIQYFVRTAMGLMGLRALSMNAEGTREILEMLTPFGAMPSFTSGPTVYLASRALATQAAGRDGELGLQLKAALAELERGRRFDMTQHEYLNLRVGLLLSDGMRECMREGARALERADQLTRLGGRLACATADRIRMSYYLRHGDLERAESYRSQVDVQAIQGGTAWQVEWFSLPFEAMAGVIWSDFLLLRRALERLERVSLELPGLVPHLLTVRAGYHFRRGEYARAVEICEPYVAAHAPGSLIGWGWMYGIFTFALLELGQVERARSVSEQALAVLGEDDRQYFFMYTTLEFAYATALALQGERERADALVRARVARIQASQDHAELAGMYQHVARMARLLGDRAELMRTLQAMRKAALRSRLPAVILLADRSTDAYTGPRSSPPPEPPGGSLDAVTVKHTPSQDATAAGAFLKDYRAPGQRNREALRILSRWIGSEEAYLYVRGDPLPKQLAALGTDLASDSIVNLVQRILSSPLSAAPAVEWLEVRVSLLPGASLAPQRGGKRFRVFALPVQPEATGWTAVVALRDESSEDVELPIALLVDVGKIVARGIQPTPET